MAVTDQGLLELFLLITIPPFLLSLAFLIFKKQNKLTWAYYFPPAAFSALSLVLVIVFATLEYLKGMEAFQNIGQVIMVVLIPLPITLYCFIATACAHVSYVVLTKTIYQAKKLVG